jgi:hypothetical protein
VSLNTIWLRATTGDAAGSSAARAVGLVNSALVLLIAVGLLLKLRLVFSLNVSWDEFSYLAQVHQYLRGELTAQFQVLHVHLFWWLPLVSTDEVSQIVVARLVMYVLGLGSCALTYLIARRFLSPTGGLFVVLIYLATSNMIEHATSFRVDPIGAVLFLASLCLLLRRPGGGRAALAGLLMALATMVTIKAAFHLAAIAAMLLVLLITTERRRETWMQIALFGLAFILGFGVLYALHRLSLATNVPADAARFASATASKMFMTAGPLPRWETLSHSLRRNPVVWTILFSGMTILVLDAIRRREGAKHQLAFFGAFVIPLLSVLIYRNAFSYFYVFILSPAVLVGGIVADRLLPRGSARGDPWALAAVAASIGALFLCFVMHYRSNAADATVAQRQVVDVVHEMFPEPVPYIDGPSMIATFPKIGFFMSTWGMQAYRSEGRPVFAGLIAERAPVLLLADTNALLDVMFGTSRTNPKHALLEADRLALAQNYIPHWGIICVAGKTLEFVSPAPMRFEMLIPGPYTVEAAGDVIIDGTRYAPGQLARLERGAHVMIPDAAPATVTLRWGERLFRPTEAPDSQEIFVPFQ